LDLNLTNNIASVTATVLNAPTITAQPQSLTVTNGNSASFSVTASGAAPLRYQWRRNGTDLAGRTNATLTVNNAQFADGGNYTVRVRNAVGGVISQPAVLTVISPPSILTPPQSRTNLAGSTATFNVTAEGTAPLNYQWFFNGTNSITAATNPT